MSALIFSEILTLTLRMKNILDRESKVNLCAVSHSMFE